MGRYSGTLANLVEEAIGAGKPSRNKSSHHSQSSRASAQNLWNKVLHYLENHSTTDGAIERPEFLSPLPPFSVPSEILDEQLLERKFGPRQDNTILKLAVTAAPAPVVAALCHLQPHAARIPDHRGKLPLHVACRRNPNDADTLQIFEILLAVYVEALAHRDSAGRTPLHCLFMYHHAPHRSVETIKTFCQPLPPKLIESLKQPQSHSNNNNMNLGAVNTTKDHHHDLEAFPLPEVPNPSNKDKVPSNAAIIPDARHGALPLHYAVMEGASRDVLRFLLQVYPESKRLVDRKGRTALAWYLGAGQATTTTTSGAGAKLLVTGEPTDPHSVSWWDKNKIESATVQLLLNSRSARMADATGRSPLHWAVCTLARNHYYLQHPQLKQQGPSVSMKTIHLLLDHYMEGLVTGDLQDKTPLHLLFDAVKEVQEQEWKRLMRNKTERNDLDLKSGGRKTAAAARDKKDRSTASGSGPTGNFAPPMEVLEILVSNSGPAGLEAGTPTNAMMEDRSAVFMEDTEGRLPIHAAMEVASSPDVIKLLIKAHPTSLVHTTEETLLSPLHAAVLSPYVAPLQTPETMQLILRAYVASRHGTYVDGRLALKMEDADGFYPIHYACKNHVCLEVLKMFVEEYPKCALFQTPDGNLPLHCLLDKHVFEGHPDGLPPIGASLADSNTWSSPKEEEFHKEKLSVLQGKITLLVDPILNSNRVQDYLKTPSFGHGMLPLHIVVAWGAGSYMTIKRMLDKCPSAAEQLTIVDGYKRSPLDLHENYKANVLGSEMTTEMDQAWQHIRELLFSYSPLLGDHRHLNDILTQSVRVVRAEIGHASSSDGEKSYHWTVEQDLKKRKDVPPIEMSDTFTSIEVPDIDHGGRPLSKKAIARSRAPTTPKTKKKPKNSNKRSSGAASIHSISRSHTSASATKKSIYDDDALDTGYVVSDGEQDDSVDFDEDYFSGPESAEEYLSDESDERFDSFDDEEYADPTVTTAESWDTSGPANPTSSSKESSNKRKQDQDSPQQEEKKEDEKPESTAANDSAALQPCGPQFSEVGLRLLTFFMLFCDEKNPSDNYASLAEGILDEVSRSVVDEVVSMPLPPYAAQYLDDGARMDGLTLRDVASPKCRELIHKLFYFLGRFDFRSETGGILLNKNADSSTVQVRSTEWIFTTEEYNEAPEVEPGEAEAQIWETGVIPPEEVGYMGASFKAMRRSICFLFTKNRQFYYNEIICRRDLGVAVEGGTFSESHILPLIAHFNANGFDRKQDRMYKNDCNNESFIMLDIFGQKGNPASGESICLADYPYALVFPYSHYGDLFDYFFRHGVDGIEETREICTQIGRSLSSMHSKGIIHGNVTMRNIVLFPPMEDVEVEEGRKHWALTNLSGACRLQGGNSYMGKVSAQGMAEFYSATLPPEMFVKLTNEELKTYREYWDFVEQEFGAEVDRSVIEPVVDFQTGASYVMRCHFVPNEDSLDDSEQTLPPLPYKLLPARESADVWAFGQLLFMLCSCGRPLFPTNARTGNLLNYKEVCDWDMQAAEAMVYEYVEDPLAQDILLRLLAPYEKRASLAFETLLNHPFFNDGDMTSQMSRALAKKRSDASVAFRRWLENNVNEKSEEGLLQERTISVSCWDFDFQTRIHLTPTALVPEFLYMRGEQLGMPCGFLILPYKLVRNKKGVLTPPSKRDVERAERLGLRMLSLSKACHFVNGIKKAVAGTTPPKGWSLAKIFESLELAKEDFSELESRFAQLGSEHVELFRSEPLQVGLKLIQEQVRDLMACYDDSSKVTLFLVDEYKGVPSVSPSSAPFPHLVQSSLKSELARHGLPFMYLCARYFRAVSGIPGFVKLIFEAAAPHVPPSWQPVCKGLDNSLDHQAIVDDLRVLCDALAASSGPSIADSFDFMQRYIGEVDPRRMYAGLKRVSCGEVSVWTGPEGVKEIQEAAKSFGFKEAIAAKIQTDHQLKSQEARIKELEEELAKLKFRNDLSLNVPDVEAPASGTTTTLSHPVFSPSGFAAELYERGMKCMEANVDIIASRTGCQGNATDDVHQETTETIEMVASIDKNNEHTENVQPEGTEDGQASDSEKDSFETPEGSLAEAEQLETDKPSDEEIMPAAPPAQQSEAMDHSSTPQPPPEQTREPTTSARPPSLRERLDSKMRLLGPRGSSSPLRKATTPTNNKKEASRFFAEQRGGMMSLPSSPRKKIEMDPSKASQFPGAPVSVPSSPRHRVEMEAPKESQDYEAPKSANGVHGTQPDVAAILAEALASSSSPGASTSDVEPENVTTSDPANALLSYLQEDAHVVNETTVVEAEQDFSESLLENLSFECIGVAQRKKADSLQQHGGALQEVETQPQVSGGEQQRQTTALGVEGPAKKNESQGENSERSRQISEGKQSEHMAESVAQSPRVSDLALITQQALKQAQQALQQHESQLQAVQVGSSREPTLQEQGPSPQPLEHAQSEQQLSSLRKEAIQHEDPQAQAPLVQQQEHGQPQAPLKHQEPQIQIAFQAQQEEQLAQLATLKQKVLKEESTKQKPNVTKPRPQTLELEPVQTQVDSCFSKLSDGAEEVKSLLDDMFAEADLVFAPTPRTPKSTQSSPRHFARSLPSTPAVVPTHQETRDEDGPESSSISTDPANADGMEESAAFLEITHKELSELKQTLIAGRAAAKEARAQTPASAESLSEMFEKEMDNFHKSTGAESPSRGIVKRNSNFFSTPKSPRSSREPSEVSGSSIEAGSVKRLTNFFLGGGKQQKPTIDVNASSPERPKLSSPQSRLRRAALECSPVETSLGF